MHSLNPFIRAFFRSSFPTQCTPVSQYILLVPITEVLLTNRDSDTDLPFADVAGTEEFLQSHVIRAPPPEINSKEVGNVRESRNKAKAFTTLNGRSVVIKDSFVYSNKGFRALNQAQLLSDALYYHDSLDAQQWLIYYISKPLIGTLEPVPVSIATLPRISGAKAKSADSSHVSAKSESSSANGVVAKKDVKTFNDVLNHFPMIARQLQPGLEKIFKDFNKEIAKQLPITESRTPTPRSRTSSMSSITNVNGSTYSAAKRRAKNVSIASSSIYAVDEEDHMRQTLEIAVNAAIDLFQLVDKQQLSLLGATTDLTGPMVERLIEKYVAEYLSDSVLFPRLRAIHHQDDHDLSQRIHNMSSIDIAQVGIDIDGGRLAKRQLVLRMSSAIDEFRKLSTASGPQDMLKILLETQKILSGSSSKQLEMNTSKMSEKTTPMNADTLVSLLLLVVIRSQVRYLQTRLAYMRNFIFIDDIESGELGYALSTYEAVLQYISTDSGGLRLASKRNRRLWQATKTGSLSEMRAILEPDDDSLSDEEDSLTHDDASFDYSAELQLPSGSQRRLPTYTDLSNGDISSTSLDGVHPVEANLNHVFPFQAAGQHQGQLQRPKSIKRVSIDLRSLSGRSEYSFRSRTDTLNSRTSIIEGDTSIETLCQSEDDAGNSILMMAIENKQPESLDYLLSLDYLFPSDIILADTNHEDTTLLSAAIQAANADVIEILAGYIFNAMDSKAVKAYLSKTDKMGRSAAHYIFNAPHLIPIFGTLLPWRLRDKNGQTPLLALCRSYDHPHYLDMVNEALQLAVDEQGDGQALHMENHIDNKGNTLLHAVKESYLALRILQQCDADPNSANHKQFTPLMMASKYGRFELVRTFFLDPRIDTQIKEYRGMTAVELAKDDEVRNRIDDLVLVSNAPMPDGRVTAIVRSFFVEDGSIRLIIKTATQSGDGLVAVTTCRRSLTDFEHLAGWLALEHPASWLPSIFNFRSPFQIPSKPSRAVLYDTQLRLDKFLQVMLNHSTFGSHELLWEFILLPEIHADMMAERSMKKAELRQEKIREESRPLQETRDIETFVSYARESIRSLSHAAKSLLKRVNSVRNSSRDLYTSMDLASRRVSDLAGLPTQHSSAMGRYVKANLPPASDPLAAFQITLLSINSTILSILSSLSRPHTLIETLVNAQKSLDRHTATIRRAKSNRVTERSVWAAALPIGALLEDNRQNQAKEAQEKLQKAREDVHVAGSELNYTYQTVASELAGWQDQHEKLMKQAIREMARTMVIKEKSRLEGMKQALRMAKQAGNAYASEYKQRAVHSA